MAKRWQFISIIVCFCVLTLALVYLTRRPLCIDSKVVERIDRVNNQNQEIAYKCSFNRHVPFSPYLMESLPSLNRRLATIEKFLESMAPFRRRIHLHVFQDRPLVYLVDANQIYIGEDLVMADGHLERAIIKSWIRDYRNSKQKKSDLFEEVMADLILFAATGKVDISDNQLSLRTKLNGSQWPQVVKSEHAYCQSPWRLSEHIEPCARQDRVSAIVAASFSVRPMLSSAAIEAYQNLKLSQQFIFLQNLRDKLRLQQIDVERDSADVNPLALATNEIKKAVSELKNMSESLTINTHLELMKLGFSHKVKDIAFDLLVVSQEKLNPKSKILSQLSHTSVNNKKAKIAIFDGHGLWLLPAKNPIVMSDFENIYSDKMILEQCGDFTFEYIMDFERITKKLVVVDACVKKDRSYLSYLNEGIEGFARDNKDVDFIQFHLPSLSMKREKIARAEKVMELIQKRDMTSPTFQSLGWQELKWSDRLSAYHPRAYVDAIEWFRVQ